MGTSAYLNARRFSGRRFMSEEGVRTRGMVRFARRVEERQEYATADASESRSAHIRDISDLP